MNNNKQNVSEAERFLQALAPDADKFCFRTFDDKKRNPQLARNFTGTLDEHADRLRKINDQGGGVFVVVNQGGHKRDEISAVRAVFADTDGARPEPIIDAMRPHIVVQSSPGNYHIYYGAQGLPLCKFSPIQSAIAEKYGTDKNVKDLPRVMRLPGFFHNKAEPFLVTITHLDTARPRYGLEELIGGLDLTMSMEQVDDWLAGAVPAFAKTGQGNLTATMARKHTLDEAERLLPHINPECDRATWFKVLGALAHELGEDARALAHRWSAGHLWKGGAA